MPKPVPASQRRRPMNAPKAAIAPLVATLAVTAVAGAVAVVLAPSEARGWAVAVVVTAWVVLAVSLAAAHATLTAPSAPHRPGPTRPNS